MNRKGFTLLEMLVATVIMGIAVTGLLTSLTSSLRNTARLTEYDRASMLARRKLDEILLLPRTPLIGVMQDSYRPEETGGVESGWKARFSLFEHGPNLAPGAKVLEKIELQVWWKAGESVRHYNVETYRIRSLLLEDVAVMAVPRG
ncbi:MAG: type II secretion system protein [Acidobacteria bacterium]|nr:type II secretion system protein [Acidobacteriota bacterium]